ncbi:hypothetical protein [Kribbella sp. NPDC006257]|uniref:hypothetical protein n=1 Tax=Kribbella sp. NPDC006257 TaxID=3156738 RepID=UPI0033A8EC3F
MRIAFGYFNKHFLMTDSEIATRRQAIVNCAAAHDHELTALFIDEIKTAPTELHRALAALMAVDDRVLIVPNLLHFAASGNPLEIRESMQCNHIKILLSQPPIRRGGCAEGYPSPQ